MSQDADIVRKAETVFCALLSPATPAIRWVPGGGPDGILTDEQASDLLTPPYAVFAVIQPDEILSGENVYQAQARAILLTDINQTPPELHGQWLSDIKAALDAIVQPATFDDHNFRLQGFAIMGPWEKIEDEEGQLRCHAIPIFLGVSG